MSRRNKSAPRGPVQTLKPSDERITPVRGVHDAFSNPTYRLGVGTQNPIEATQYPLTRMTDNYVLLNSLYRSNWVVQNVVQIIPDDMLREWYTITGITPEDAQAIVRVERATQLRNRLADGLRWGRLYGGAGGIILIKGQEDRMDQPLELDEVLPGTFTGLYVFDRWSGISPGSKLVEDMSDMDFGLPEYYEVISPEMNFAQKIHHSRVVRFIGRALPYVEEIAELYWGESEVEALYQDVVKHDNVAYNMAALTFHANVDTMEIENLDQLFGLGTTQQQVRFWNLMQAQSVVKSNFGTRLVNKGDNLTSTQYTFSGLKDVYDAMALEISGASRIPMTKLFGRAPSGMNATGASDLQNYYDYIDTLRESKLRPVLERLMPIICMSAFGAVPEGMDLVFPPLWSPSAKETAEIAERKVKAIVTAFQAGLLTQGQAQFELRSLTSTTGLFDGIPEEAVTLNKDVTFSQATALRDPMSGLEDV